MPVSVVIMAGGSGERFWPYSRKDRPKQFLPVVGGRSLLQATVARALRLTDSAHIYVVTGERYRALVAEQIPELPSDNVLYEPEGRDTAPCIALAAAHIDASDPEGTMIVLPADHLVPDEDAFESTLKRAVKAAQTTDGLVTVGIPPTRPETGYGYIRMEADDGSGVRRVLAFKEKPDAETAEAYVASKQYVWNGGMFVWNVAAIRRAVSEHLPGLSDGLRPIEEAIGSPALDARLKEHFPHLPKVSIDYGVMEKADNVWVVPAGFDWDDLGSWNALERTLEADSAGNRIDARALAVDTAGSIIAGNAGSERLIVAFGLEDALIVDTPDVVLVAPKQRAPELKRVLAELKEKGLNRYYEQTAIPGSGDRFGKGREGADGTGRPGMVDAANEDDSGSSEVRIRRSVAADAPALMAIDNAVWDARKSPSVVHWDDVEAFHEQFPPGSLFVAEVDGFVAGYLDVHAPTPLRSNRHVGELAIAVDRAYRRRGVGRRLLQAAEEEAKARGLRKLSLRVLATNDAAIAFYTSLGYKEQGRLFEEFFLDGAYVDDVFMYKTVAGDASTS